MVVVELGSSSRSAQTWGAEVARHAVREAAQCLRGRPATSDYCTRLGPSRFGVVLTETDEIAAINFVERVREAGPKSMPKGFDGSSSASAGRAPGRASRPTPLVRRRDARLASELAEA